MTKDFIEGDYVILSEITFGDGLKHSGKIRGRGGVCLTTFYIVEVLDRKPDEKYPYTCIYVDKSLIEKW